MTCPVLKRKRKDEMKICSKCKKTKPLSEFNRDRSAKSHRRSDCRECLREYRRVHFAEAAAKRLLYYYHNRELLIEKAKLWNKTNKKRRMEIIRRYNQKRRRLGTDGQ